MEPIRINYDYWILNYGIILLLCGYWNLANTNFETYTWEYGLIKQWMILRFEMDALELMRVYCYMRSVDIEELLKSRGDWYSMIVMIIFMANIKWVIEYLIRRVF